MGTCSAEDCTGHLGKFSDCVAEALHTCSLEGQPEQTGDVAWSVWACIMSFPTGEYICVSEDPYREVWVPRGQYVLTEDDRGFVDVERYNYGAEARARFDAIAEDYSKWLDQDDDNALFVSTEEDPF